MPAVGAEAATVRETPSDELVRNGYWFWGLVITAILLVEVAGAARNWLDDHIGVSIPWTTFSEMVGHLEELWPGTAVFVVAIIAPAAIYALGLRSPARHSQLGRVSFRSAPIEPVHWYTPWLVFALCVIVGVVAVSTFEDDFVRGYFIYGSLFALGIVVPSVLVLLRSREVGFTSLFKTIEHLRARRDWRAWLATTALSAGLTILLLHLAFYPWPDITKAPVKYAGLTANEARSTAAREVGPGLVYSTQARGVVANKDAWLVFFLATDGTDSGCIVNVREDAVDTTEQCNP